MDLIATLGRRNGIWCWYRSFGEKSLGFVHHTSRSHPHPSVLSTHSITLPPNLPPTPQPPPRNPSHKRHTRRANPKRSLIPFKQHLPLSLPPPHPSSSPSIPTPRAHRRRHRRRHRQPDRVPQLRKHIEHPARQPILARIGARDDQARHREQRVRAYRAQQHGGEGVRPVRGGGVYGGHQDRAGQADHGGEGDEDADVDFGDEEAG